MSMKKVRKYIKQIKNIDWDNIQIDSDNGLSKKQICNKYGVRYSLLKYAEENKGLIKLKKVKYIATKETREKISKGVKNYLNTNKDNHVWKKNSKFKSKPCELFKENLKKNNINFVEEYTPLVDRAFSVDVAFPDKKIGIEINGNQHYDSFGNLKPYYQNRHNLIIADGWVLYEYHFSIVFNSELIKKIIHELKNNFNLSLIDYTFFIKKINTEKIKFRKLKSYNKSHDICECGNKKLCVSKKCIECDLKYKKSRRLHKRPTKKVLAKNILKLGYKGAGAKYGISDNGARKWAKQYGIIK